MSKRDYYEVLGLAKGASEEDIKKSYRRLAMLHHPDRNPGEGAMAAEEKFKEAKEAYEMLSDPQKRAAYDSHGHAGTNSQGNGWNQAQPSDMQDILDQLRRARGMHAQFRQFRQQAEFNAKVTLESAYHGFDVAVALPDGGSVTVRVKPGTPNGYKTVHDVNESLVVIVVTRIVDARFKVKDPTDCGFAARQIDGRPITCLETGDIETTIEADALDLILGGWVKVPDFLGDTYDVRIPSGFNPMHRLRVKGKGYYNWLHELQRPESTRSDLFVKVIPLFAAPANLDRAKIEALEALTRPKAPDATPPTS